MSSLLMYKTRVWVLLKITQLSMDKWVEEIFGYQFTRELDSVMCCYGKYIYMIIC